MRVPVTRKHCRGVSDELRAHINELYTTGKESLAAEIHRRVDFNGAEAWAWDCWDARMKAKEKQCPQLS